MKSQGRELECGCVVKGKPLKWIIPFGLDANLSIPCRHCGEWIG